MNEVADDYGSRRTAAVKDLLRSQKLPLFPRTWEARHDMHFVSESYFFRAVQICGLAPRATRPSRHSGRSQASAKARSSSFVPAPAEMSLSTMGKMSSAGNEVQVTCASAERPSRSTAWMSWGRESASSISDHTPDLTAHMR